MICSLNVLKLVLLSLLMTASVSVFGGNSGKLGDIHLWDAISPKGGTRGHSTYDIAYFSLGIFVREFVRLSKMYFDGLD